jgi:hypothetical protein
VTIERGHDWGVAAPRPDGVVELDRDADAAVLINRHRREGTPLPVIGLLGGDMRRTLGGADAGAGLAAEVVLYTVDIGGVEIDGRRMWFLSHVVARRHWWRGEVAMAMNAEFIGPWDVAPRSHPNDGRLDLLTTMDMGLLDRWKARRRLPLGTHVPHPAISERRTSAAEVELLESLPVWVDGVLTPGGRRLKLWCEPDALKVCI